jgi:hypothetical protein
VSLRGRNGTVPAHGAFQGAAPASRVAFVARLGELIVLLDDADFAAEFVARPMPAAALAFLLADATLRDDRLRVMHRMTWRELDDVQADAETLYERLGLSRPA